MNKIKICSLFTGKL